MTRLRRFDHVGITVADLDKVTASSSRSLHADSMVRIVVTPTWAKLIDVETTLPSAVEELISQREARQRG